MRCECTAGWHGLVCWIYGLLHARESAFLADLCVQELSIRISSFVKFALFIVGRGIAATLDVMELLVCDLDEDWLEVLAFQKVAVSRQLELVIRLQLSLALSDDVPERCGFVHVKTIVLVSRECSRVYLLLATTFVLRRQFCAWVLFLSLHGCILGVACNNATRLVLVSAHSLLEEKLQSLSFKRLWASCWLFSCVASLSYLFQRRLICHWVICNQCNLFVSHRFLYNRIGLLAQKVLVFGCTLLR